jgi:copper oxidase (laccase) domain-containing protein
MREQARRIGISEENISDMDECTFCLPEKYFSYRRDAPAYIETQMAYITQQD